MWTIQGTVPCNCYISNEKLYHILAALQFFNVSRWFFTNIGCVCFPVQTKFHYKLFLFLFSLQFQMGDGAFLKYCVAGVVTQEWVRFKETEAKSYEEWIVFLVLQFTCCAMLYKWFILCAPVLLPAERICSHSTLQSLTWRKALWIWWKMHRREKSFHSLRSNQRVTDFNGLWTGNSVLTHSFTTHRN